MDHRRRHSIGTMSSFVHFNSELGAHTWRYNDVLSRRNVDKEIYVFSPNCFFFHKRQMYTKGCWTLMRPIDIAVRNDKTVTIKKICEWGPNVQSCGEWFPLNMAIRNGNRAIIKRLLDMGADINYNDKYNETPLITTVDYLSGNDAVEITSFLLENGAQIEKPLYYNRDETALYHAVECLNVEAALSLIDKGANTNIVDVLGLDLFDNFAFCLLADIKVLQKRVSPGQIVCLMHKLREGYAGHMSDSDFEYRCSVLCRSVEDGIEMIENCTECSQLCVKNMYIIPCLHILCDKCCRVRKGCPICNLDILYIL